MSDGECGPFADAVGCENGRSIGRCSEKRGSGMRLMMLGEQHLAARHAEMGRDDAADPHLLAERVLHGVPE